MTDWETRYYEAQASHTEANGMLTMERDHWKAKAEGLRESMRLDAETMAAKDAEIARLTSCISETVNDAARYRWLRSEDTATNPLYYPFWQEFNAKLCREAGMDALIDSAMTSRMVAPK